MSEKQLLKRSLGHFQQPNSCRQNDSGSDKLSESTKYLANHATVSPDVVLVHDKVPSTNAEDNDENIYETATKVTSYL